MAEQPIIDWLRRKTGKRGVLRGNGLVERVKRDLQWDRTDVLRGFRALRETGVLECDDWLGDEPLSQVTVRLPEQRSAAESAWLAVLAQAGLDAADAEALSGLGEALAGVPRQDLQRLIDGLLKLRRDQYALDGLTRFEVSARYLLGSSKALDALPNVSLRRFGIDPGRFPPFPGYVIVAGPPDPEAVILVENPQAFECALTAAGTERAAWICTFGYGLSLRRGQHGEQLASLVESRLPPRTLVRLGNPPAWEILLRHPRILFWGDLDREGLAIFGRLHRHNPRIGLSGIYAPMLEALRANNGHPYCALVGKPGQGERATDACAAELELACREQGLDQEWVPVAEISRWWKQDLGFNAAVAVPLPRGPIPPENRG